MGGNGLGHISSDLQSSNQATTFDINDLNGSGVRVQETRPMNFPRQHGSSIVLPTGRVLVTGGSKHQRRNGANAVLAAEIWNPATGRWTVGASARIFRGYHSSTALLPNGVVFSGGGGM